MATAQRVSALASRFITSSVSTFFQARRPLTSVDKSLTLRDERQGWASDEDEV